MTAGGAITTRPRILFLYLAGGKNLLILQEHRSELVLSFRVCPTTRSDITDRIDYIAGTIARKRTMGPLGSVADNRNLRVDQQVQPVNRLFDRRTAFQPDDAGICTTVQAFCTAFDALARS